MPPPQAVQEFAQHGLAGTRVEHIAQRAGVNKERIYNYFGSKEQLFATVLSEELERVAEAVPVLGGEGDDIGEYAGRAFDYHCERVTTLRASRPNFARLHRDELIQSMVHRLARITSSAEPGCPGQGAVQE